MLCTALWSGWTPPVLAASGKSYEALRLITEAMHEINQKFVWQKDEGEMIYGALRGMMHSLDPDSSFLTPQEYKELEKGPKTPEAEAGMELVVKDNLLTAVSVLDGGPAFQAGLRPGDHIIKVNGHMVRNLTTQEGVRLFQSKPGTQLKLQVLRNNQIKPLDITVTLAPLGPAPVTIQMLPDNFAYLRIPFFTDDTPAELGEALKKVKRQRPPMQGLILDLRNNARGNMQQAVRTASVLMGEKLIVTTRGRQSEAPQSYSGKARDQELKPLLPLVVLVDQGTARAAEIVAGALQNHGAGTLLGAKTFGLCGITRVVPLKDGSALVMTMAQCYTPKGQKITGKGLEPEVVGSKLETAEAPQSGSIFQSPQQDPWVAKAVELLKKGTPSQLVKQNGSS